MTTQLSSVVQQGHKHQKEVKEKFQAFTSLWSTDVNYEE
jgi:hypothetical protein